MKIEKIVNYSRIFANLAKVKLLNKKVPFMLEFQITKACNLKCKYCYAALETLSEEEDLSFDEIKRIIDEFYLLGTRVIRILGGEPLIRKDIGKIIRYMHSKKMFIEMATNGELIERYLDDLKYLDILQISVDGNEKSHDAVRGQGSYKKMLKGLETAVNANLPVRIHGVFNKFSIDASDGSPITGLAELSKKYDIPFNFCQFVLGEDEKSCGGNKPAYVSYEDTKKYHEELIEYKRKGYKFFNSYAAMEQIMNWVDPNKDIIYEKDSATLPKFYSRCQAGELYCFLDSDGSLYPCVPLWKRGSNIKEVGIKQALTDVEKSRKNTACYSCVSLGDIEFSKTLSISPKVLMNTLLKVMSVNK